MDLNEFELRDERETYGGGDGKAINRHSVRVYKIPGHDDKIYLDRTLDGCPPFFHLYTFPNAALNERSGYTTFAENIPVKGKEYWDVGERKSHATAWKLAVIMAGEALEAWFAEVAG